MKGGKATEKQMQSSKMELKLSTEDFQIFITKKGHGLIIYYSIINYPQTFITSQMPWVRDSRAKLF